MSTDREKWSWKLDFLATNIGFVACFENMFRLPYLCYRNGGFIFFIPYLLAVTLITIPLMFLEMVVGQYTSSGSIRAWKICPLFRGVGVASTVALFWRNIYYNVILAYSLYYLYSSCIGDELPWKSCGHEWNTPTCLDYDSEWVCINGTYLAVKKSDIPQLPTNQPTSEYVWDVRSVPSFDDYDRCGVRPYKTVPSQEFWKHKVRGQPEVSRGMFDVGGVVWHLALCLFLAWTLVYFGLWKGVKWMAKVFYFNVPFIYVVLFALLIRGVTLPGAFDGLLFFIFPNVHRLGVIDVWIAAGKEAFYSFSIGLGAFTALGSFNKFHYNFYRDCMIVSYLKVITSMYCGVVVFSFIGFVAYTEGIQVNSAVELGVNLMFSVFPHAFSHIASSRVWSFLFFLVLLNIGLNIQLVTVKAFVASLTDIVPVWMRIRYYRELLVLGVCVINFLIGLALVTKGGWHVFVFFDFHGSGLLTLTWICLYESIAIGWFYGFRRISSNIAEMLKWRQIEWYLVGWLVTCPILTLLLWIAAIFDLAELRFYQPPWAIAIGVFIDISTMVWIHGAMLYAIIYQLIKGDGSIWTRLKLTVQPAITPLREEEEEPAQIEMM
ncbi:sodium- and chloride-dependent betaine transporter-like [Lytechinus variegatus]|uniref:sodium- and chloride-dependent betaine transporter-like n=1 Tax=Lytechinus variegatus TaxID=7654 RepID=UPI001BB1333C|nr:sodium- and chloride-dependent betaine transporter-like [Lytechinus variegatus]